MESPGIDVPPEAATRQPWREADSSLFPDRRSAAALPRWPFLQPKVFLASRGRVPIACAPKGDSLSCAMGMFVFPGSLDTRGLWARQRGSESVMSEAEATAASEDAQTARMAQRENRDEVASWRRPAPALRWQRRSIPKGKKACWMWEGLGAEAV